VFLMIVVASIAGATRADAHAVLISAAPAPQTTVQTAPTEIKLQFSEQVEVAFGAVKVYDVNAKRIDTGVIKRENGGTELVVPVKSAGQKGTFTVVWQVVSADGHVVGNAYVYYVGAPSTVSPAAIPTGTVKRTWVTWGSGVARFCWYSSIALLAGVIVVRRRVWGPVAAVAGIETEEATRHLREWSAQVLRIGAVALVLSAVAVLDMESASVSGKSLWGAAAPSVVRQVLRTEFGHGWLWQVGAAVIGAGIALVLAGPQLPFGRPAAWLTGLGVALGVACLATAYTGHASQTNHRWLDITALGLHFGAAATWAGGLVVLSLLAVPAWQHVDRITRPGLVRSVVRAFGRIAFPGVILLVASGIVVAWSQLAAFSDLWDTTYGKVISAKIVLLGVALALAGWHRYVVGRRLGVKEDLEQSDRMVRSFEATVTTEWSVLLGAFALAAALVALVPGTALAQIAATAGEKDVKVGQYTAQLSFDPSSTGSNEVHLTFVTAGGLAASAVQQAGLKLVPPRGTAPTVSLQLAAPGHFVGTTTISTPGLYTVTISTPSPQGDAAASTKVQFSGPAR
jgi:copper transport protein